MRPALLLAAAVSASSCLGDARPPPALPAEIIGRVQLADLVPPLGCLAVVEGTPIGERCDARGNFHLRAVPRGRWTVRVVGEVDAQPGAAPMAPVRIEVNAVPGLVVDLGSLQAGRPGAVTGQIRGTGDPEDVLVVASDYGVVARARAPGPYLLAAVPPGPQTLVLLARGGSSRATVFVPAGETRAGVDFELAQLAVASGTVAGQVRSLEDPAVRPQAGVEVALVRLADGQTAATAGLDGAGRFTLSAPPGLYLVRASAPGAAVEYPAIALEAGQALLIHTPLLLPGPDQGQPMQVMGPPGLTTSSPADTGGLRVGRPARTRWSGGRVTRDLTLTAGESPYLVTGSIVVAERATLTLEPGVELLLARGVGIQVGELGTAAGPEAASPGTLIAAGTALQPIRLGSAEVPPAPGDWRGIRFLASEGFPPSALVHATLEGCGSADAACVVGPPSEAQLRLVHLSITDYAGGGVDLTAATMAVSPPPVTPTPAPARDGGIDAAKAGQPVPQPAILPGVEVCPDTTATPWCQRSDHLSFLRLERLRGPGYALRLGRGPARVRLAGLATAGAPVRIVGSAAVAALTATADALPMLPDDPAPTIEVEGFLSPAGSLPAGSVVRFRNGGGLVTGPWATLAAVGTAARPIVFESASDEPWSGIALGVDDGSRLVHAIIRGAGRRQDLSTLPGTLVHTGELRDVQAGLALMGAAAPVVSRVLIESSVGYGLQLIPARPGAILDVTFGAGARRNRLGDCGGCP